MTGKRLSVDARITEMRKQCAALTLKVTRAQALQLEAEADREKAERALQSMDREYKRVRERLKFVEAELASLRPNRTA